MVLYLTRILQKKPIFRDLNADDVESEVTVIESMCMNCEENGQTRLLLTKIPFYKEVVIMSFKCEHCGFQNNEIQSAGRIAERGIRITLKVTAVSDLNRQVVKSDFTSVKILEVDFEVPAQSQKGEVTTIEGIIDRAVAGLNQDQVTRRIQHPEVAEQIDQFIQKLNDLKTVKTPFTIILEDISGNAFITNPNAPIKDPNMTTVHFKRNKDQNHLLGIFTTDEVGEDSNESKLLHPIEENEFTLEDLQGEVLQIPTNCNNCGSPCQANMKVTNIPHFKEVIIMALACDTCGNRTNEVKSGGGIEEKGVRIEVKIASRDDFSRDVLKSDTCSLQIPELELEVGPNAIGGRFTTVEGIVTAIKEQLGVSGHMFGDSEDPKAGDNMEKFLNRLDDVLKSKTSVTLVLDDPAGNSYIQSLSDANEPDDQLKITRYERTFEQNDELGLNDMKTENYQET
ncbi:zinc finger protein ZPR1 [Chrysoperla carnea]|uniref:zinc finger protein ZPR1 n=1 Tax=Chrysoperla carnea TaxID=189513 RepID=UPI001D098585|nr:zinc finger protein ZPR1 [Chrysoperla carnea]